MMSKGKDNEQTLINVIYVNSHGLFSYVKCKRILRPFPSLITPGFRLVNPGEPTPSNAILMISH
jgi:hypothetical protein